MVSGARAVERCDLLAVVPYSDTSEGLYRGYLTPAYAAAQRQIANWMAQAGMATRIDPAGNLVGRFEGSRSGPSLIIGSHLDSVRDAGHYDGPLGIMLGIEIIAALHAAGRRLDFPVEIYAFGDEEGSRFPLAMLSSRAVAGTLDTQIAEPADGAGIGLNEALALFGAEARVAIARDLPGLAQARHPGAFAYVEAHIEQGPVLEAEGLAVGNVTAIAAQKRYGVKVTGRAGHAGTTAMALRRDALAAAAEMVLAVEELAVASGPDHVATAAMLAVEPRAANVIAGTANFTLDVRAATDANCARLLTAILVRCRAIATRREVNLDVDVLHELPASPCDPALIDFLDHAIRAEGIRPRRLISGAGHDAMVLSALCPTAMLFIRCGGGVSHNPAESVTAQDAELAGRVLLRFIESLGVAGHA